MKFFTRIKLVFFLKKLYKTVRDAILLLEDSDLTGSQKKEVVINRILKNLEGNDLIPFIEDEIVLRPLLSFLIEYIIKKLRKK